jgi:hypothetical protein
MRQKKPVTQMYELGKYFGFNRYSNLMESVNPPEAGYDLPPLLSPSPPTSLPPPPSLPQGQECPTVCRKQKNTFDNGCIDIIAIVCIPTITITPYWCNRPTSAIHFYVFL